MTDQIASVGQLIPQKKLIQNRQFVSTSDSMTTD